MPSSHHSFLALFLGFLSLSCSEDSSECPGSNVHRVVVEGAVDTDDTTVCMVSGSIVGVDELDALSCSVDGTACVCELAASWDEVRDIYLEYGAASQKVGNTKACEDTHIELTTEDLDDGVPSAKGHSLSREASRDAPLPERGDFVGAP